MTQLTEGQLAKIGFVRTFDGMKLAISKAFVDSLI